MKKINKLNGLRSFILFLTGFCISALVVFSVSYLLFVVRINALIEEDLNTQLTKSIYLMHLSDDKRPNLQKEATIKDFVIYDCYQSVNGFYIKTGKLKKANYFFQQCAFR